MKVNIESYSLPPVYKRYGKECYLDPIRKKLIYITLEETVRQRMVSYLMKKLEVPKEMIVVEQNLSHYHVNSRKRADIIVHGEKDGICYPSLS